MNSPQTSFFLVGLGNDCNIVKLDTYFKFRVKWSEIGGGEILTDFDKTELLPYTAKRILRY
jgi:hypothetical protein